ncbi:transketolase [Natranaerovirga hydrolytica]|uniref:Transketolase n=1 Tax=Natranaerovirga hydrolytica TaxID=680378 RepID=A0A4R1M822_9FIRM|nr:transketolase [Natranaerovirga hydrolytica]TCK87937.1 transketolase [Natranaerovirga hydrolytica]
MKSIDNLTINTIRMLSVEAVEKAKSGHPGLPMGAAPMAYELWAKHMKHNPSNPDWINRDRFILSAGHGSMLLYSLLHLFGYGLELDDLKAFRQWGSKTPGHPEYGHTVGVETTTGPLGAGFANGVGMAMAEAHLATKFNKKEYDLIDHYTYVLVGDGCLMEGITNEAASLAGTLQLDKFIVLYDSNKISIEGDTDIAFTEKVGKRFEALNFQVLTVEDGNDIEAIGKAIAEAKADNKRPSFIEIKTQIGYGCPNKQGTADAHGAPLGEENIECTKEYLKWVSDQPFHVPEEVYEYMKELRNKGSKEEALWNEKFETYKKAFPELAKEWDTYFSQDIAVDLLKDEDFWAFEDKPMATRSVSGEVINRLKDKIPNLIGGSADLSPSTKTLMNNESSFSSKDYSGRNLHFGVREMAMAGIGNGMYLHGGLKVYVSTFFVFSDYFKPMARLAALMEIPLTYVLTHDSIGVGEDGPTHEPIEQLASLRSTPNFIVFRPADATETAAGWYKAITSKTEPVALVLTRQNLPQLKETSKEALKGGYILLDSQKEQPDVILMASGSEVELIYKAHQVLKDEGIDARVISMPSFELFDQQSESYKESVLPKGVRKRIAVEAAATYGWHKYTGIDGDIIGLDHFGASAPGGTLFEKFGYTVENVVERTKSMVNKY